MSILHLNNVAVLSTSSRGRPKAEVLSIDKSPHSSPSSEVEGIQRMAVHECPFFSIGRTAMHAGPVSDPTALQHSLSMRPTSMPGHLEMKFSNSIAYATTATCAASTNNAMMRFSAPCSAVPQVPASASHSAPRWAWRPLPNASLDRRLRRNCRLGCACLAEHKDANIVFMTRESLAPVSSHNDEEGSRSPCLHMQLRLFK